MDRHYFYARSFYKNIPIAKQNRKGCDYFKGQVKKYWLQNNKYLQGMIALTLHREDIKDISLDIVRALKENALFSGYKYQDRLGYYESTEDASTNFFFDYLPKKHTYLNIHYELPNKAISPVASPLSNVCMLQNLHLIPNG